MRNWLVILAFCFIFFSSHGIAETETSQKNSSALTFDVRQRDYLFSTVFEMNTENEFLGSVVKSFWHIKTHYDLYNAQGECESVGICRLLTLGAIYSWGTEIDVYDGYGEPIGVIDGQVVTGASAKFSFYDGRGTKIGVVYLDRSNAAFTLLDPEYEQRVLASFRRNFIRDVIDYWDVKIYNHCKVDMRIMKIFAAFAVGTQEDFKEDI